jgi:tRNA pseudouridine38-40 synthase
MKAICFSCQSVFECLANSHEKICWCIKKPTVSIDYKNKSCLCEFCLDKQCKLGELSCFRIHLSYLGSQFSGFQIQNDRRTVASELTKALIIVTKQKIAINVAGRTDSGVHARGQVISVQFYTHLTPKQLTLALAHNLPTDISVWRIDKMPLGFDARRQSIGKLYKYRIFQGLVKDPFLSKYSLHIRDNLNIGAMKKAAQHFLGEHDFSSFRASLCSSSSTKRYIWHADVAKHGSLIEIDIRGNAFCQNMVRIMVGTLIEIGRGRRTPDQVKIALIGKDRKLAGITAKAYGLTLEKVYYPDDLSDALLPIQAKFPRFPITDASWGYKNDQIIYGPS